MSSVPATRPELLKRFSDELGTKLSALENGEESPKEFFFKALNQMLFLLCSASQSAADSWEEKEMESSALVDT